MSRNLDQLYQEMILEHNRNPRNFGKLEACTHQSHGKNPLCGDDFQLYLTIEDDVIVDVKFEGSGCAISKSSGSLMSSAIKTKSVGEATTLKDAFLNLVMDDELRADTKDIVGHLKIFEGVKKFPIRVKCATLIWRALEAAMAREAVVSTE